MREGLGGRHSRQTHSWSTNRIQSCHKMQTTRHADAGTHCDFTGVQILPPGGACMRERFRVSESLPLLKQSSMHISNPVRISRVYVHVGRHLLICHRVYQVYVPHFSSRGGEVYLGPSSAHDGYRHRKSTGAREERNRLEGLSQVHSPTTVACESE